MSGTERVIISLADIPHAKVHGRYLRSCCPVHGGDNPTALEVEREGEYAGFGRCYTRGCLVLVRELNPEEATRRERGQGRAPSQRRITPASLLRPVARPRASEPTPAEWQRAELATLTRWYPRMRERLADERARAYLDGRAISLELAEAAGVGYIPADARLPDPLRKWRDRLVFPLGSAAGRGFAGRSLRGWVAGMDENVHKALLDAKDRPEAELRTWGHRWEKTYPAGWLGYDALASAAGVVLVEGPLDALALQTAGLNDVPVVALVGTAGHAAWIPDTVGFAVLALDGDGPGRKAAADLAYELRVSGLTLKTCIPDPKHGKDWSAAWRVAGIDGVASVFDAVDELSIAPVIVR